MTKFHGSDETIGGWLVQVNDLSQHRRKLRLNSYQTFLNSLLDLLNLDLTEPFDL